MPVKTPSNSVRELRLLNSIAETLHSAPDMRQALERTLALVAEMLGLTAGWVWLLDTNTGQFYNAASINLPPYLQAPVRMTGNACWCIDEFREGKLAPTNINVMECSRLVPAVSEGQMGAACGLRCHASIPLEFQNKPLGIMNIAAPEWRKLTRRELRLLSTVAYQMGISLERARLADESARMARLEERTRIAREIHDTLAQDLTAIGLQIDAGLNCLDSDTEKARARFSRALEVTKAGLEEARRSVLNLRSGTPDGKPLTEALASLAKAVMGETGITVRLQTVGEQSLPLPVEAELYAIAKEALMNIDHHANAAEATVLLVRRPKLVRLTVQDNGSGFDTYAEPNGGHGLLGMRERARLLGGSLRIVSSRKRGTTVSVAVPLNLPDEVVGSE